MRYREVLEELRTRANPADLEGMARFGINTKRALGGSRLPDLRALAKRIGTDHELAFQLWRSKVHEARILAPMVDDPDQVTEDQMETWAKDFDSWDVVDGVCCTLFDRTPFAWDKAVEWSEREEEFVKRAAFTLMACLAVHDKESPDARFESLLPIIEREAGDRRNYVRKAVTWALRQIGKRNVHLNRQAIRTAERILQKGPRSGRWVASDALRELGAESVRARLRRRGSGSNGSSASTLDESMRQAHRNPGGAGHGS
jgi:3-methyladenine DNA glycosylase AlkD